MKIKHSSCKKSSKRGSKASQEPKNIELLRKK